MNGFDIQSIILLDEIPSLSQKARCDAIILARIEEKSVVVFLEEARSLHVGEDINQLKSSIYDDELWEMLSLPNDAVVIPVMHKTRRMKKLIIDIIKSQRIRGQPIVVMGCHEKLINKVLLV